MEKQITKLETLEDLIEWTVNMDRQYRDTKWETKWKLNYSRRTDWVDKEVGIQWLKEHRSIPHASYWDEPACTYYDNLIEEHSKTRPAEVQTVVWTLNEQTDSWSNVKTLYLSEDLAKLIDAAWNYKRAPTDPRKIWYPG